LTFRGSAPSFCKSIASYLLFFQEFARYSGLALRLTSVFGVDTCVSQVEAQRLFIFLQLLIPSDIYTVSCTLAPAFRRS
ncbi:hypothetical protein HAX54_000583, partial [Datura stramonium]|nr:hypothetical protein [Datura stramonium]